jgi:aldose sugar dehydrogenase
MAFVVVANEKCVTKSRGLRRIRGTTPIHRSIDRRDIMDRMRWSGWPSILVFAAGAAACDGGSPPNSPDPGGTGERISGSERLGWNQAASSAAELSTFRYAAYVDGARVELTDVSCGAAGGGFQCNSRLPPMTPGAHAIELASFVTNLGAVVESGRSAPLRVILAGATVPPDSTNTTPNTAEQTTADGIRLAMTVVMDRVESPTALVFSPDGRAFVAERRGRVRILEVGALTPGASLDDESPALELQDVLVTGSLEGGVLDVAIDPEFARTRFAYVLYTTASADGSPMFRVARYREVGGRLGERAILLADIAASAERPAGAIGFGLDRKLYVALDDGGDPAAAQRASSYNGKVLRLESSGTTPVDQATRGPVYLSGYRSPRGFDWHPVSGALWVADVLSPAVEELRVSAGGSTSRTRTVPLPSRTGAMSMTFYRGRADALQGDLLVAAGEGRHLLRLRFDRRDSTRLVSTERLFDGLPGPATLVVVGPDGAVYLGTDRAILRVGPR